MDLYLILTKTREDFAYCYKNIDEQNLCINCGKDRSNHTQYTFECFWDNICQFKHNKSYDEYLKLMKNYSNVRWSEAVNSITFGFKPLMKK